MPDGFYTNDDDDAPGCFGGYGSDGAWAYADDSGARSIPPAPGAYEAPPPAGAYGSAAPHGQHSTRQGGKGGYARAS